MSNTTSLGANDSKYLPITNYDRENNVKLVDVSSAKGHGDIEYEIFAPKNGDLNNNGTIPSQCTTICLMCDISLPTCYIIEHNQSTKHKIYKSIMDNALERVKKYLLNEEHTVPVTKKLPCSYFCDVCCLAVLNSDKDTHEKTQKHSEELKKLKQLEDFLCLFSLSVLTAEENEELFVTADSEDISSNLDAEDIGSSDEVNSIYKLIESEVKSDLKSDSIHDVKLDAKPDVNSDVKSDTKSDVNSVVKLDVKSDAESDVNSVGKLDTKPDVNSDVKLDAKTDVNSDVKSDTKSDVNSDVKLDAKPDVNSDVKVDAKPDVNSDVKSDAKSDVNSDVKTDAKSDVNSVIKLDVNSDFKLDAKPDVKSDAESDVNAVVKLDTKPDVNSDVKLDAKTDVNSDVKSDTKSDVNSDVKLDAKTDVNSDVKVDAKPDVNSDVKSDAKSDVNSDVKTDAKSDVNSDVKSVANADVNSDIKSDAKPDVNSDVKSDLKTDLKSDLKTDLKFDVKLDAKKDVNSDGKSDLKFDVESILNFDIKLDFKSSFMFDFESDVKSDVKSNVKSDVKSDPKSESPSTVEPATKSRRYITARRSLPQGESKSKVSELKLFEPKVKKEVILKRGDDSRPYIAKALLADIFNDIVEITFTDEKVIYVYEYNYNGFIKVRFSTICLLCNQFVSNTFAHKVSPEHLKKVQVPIDENCVRKIENNFNHCIICNKIFPHVFDHNAITSLSHKRCQSKNMNSSNLSSMLFFYKTCKTVSEEKNNIPDYHHFVIHIDSLKCKVCNQSVPNSVDIAQKHLSDTDNSHVELYKKLLEHNSLTQVNDKHFKCNSCNNEAILKGNELMHILEDVHLAEQAKKWEKLSQHVFELTSELSRLKSELSKVNVSPTHTSKLREYELPYGICNTNVFCIAHCTVCDVNLSNSLRNIYRHIRSTKHKDNYALQ